MSRYKIIRSNFIPPGPRILPRCFIYRRAKAALNPPSPTVDKPAVPAGPKKDYTLKEGQTFSINIPGREKKAPTGADLLGLALGAPSLWRVVGLEYHFCHLHPARNDVLDSARYLVCKIAHFVSIHSCLCRKSTG